MVTRPVERAIAQRRPRRGHAVAREGATFVDERGGQVERDREAVAFEQGKCDLDEVGGAVVKGDRDRIGGAGRIGPGERFEARIEWGHPAGGGQRLELRLEQLDGQVDLRRGAAPDPVVEQHDDATARRAYQIGGNRRAFDHALRARIWTWSAFYTPPRTTSGLRSGRATRRCDRCPCARPRLRPRPRPAAACACPSAARPRPIRGPRFRPPPSGRARHR